MTDELQMADAVRMERAIIRIALLLAPDEAAVGVNFDELPGQVQALVVEREWLRSRVGWLRRAYTELNIARHGLVDVLASAQRAAQNADRQQRNAEAERDRLRSGLDTILDGLVGLDSDDAYVAITMEHLNVVRAMLRKAGT